MKKERAEAGPPFRGSNRALARRPVNDWAYLLDRFPNFAVSQGLRQKVVIKPNAMAADQTSRLIMIPCGYVTGGDTAGYGFYINVFHVTA